MQSYEIKTLRQLITNSQLDLNYIQMIMFLLLNSGSATQHSKANNSRGKCQEKWKLF